MEPTPENKTLTVVVELPPNELKPNSRPHFREKAKQKAYYRNHASEEAQVAVWKKPRTSLTMPWTEVTIKVTYYHKTKAFADRDNILASMKAAFDGLVDAGLLTDDRDVTYLPVVREHDKDEPRVELVITDFGKGTGE